MRPFRLLPPFESIWAVPEYVNGAWVDYEAVLNDPSTWRPVNRIEQGARTRRWNYLVARHWKAGA